MNPKQQRFVAEYLIDLNATKAAERAGYTAKRLDQAGYELLSNPEIASAIAAGKAKQLGKADLSATRVLEEMRRLAFSDVRGLFDDKGNLVPIHLLNDEQAASIAGLEVIIKNAEAGDGKTDKVHKLKVWDKPKMLDLLARHFNLITEQVNITADAEHIAKLHAGRKRAADAKRS